MYEICFDHRPYRLDLVELNNGDSFWAVCGSKKGSKHTGGGIPISGYRLLYGLYYIINNIAFLNSNKIEPNVKLCCFYHRNRVICGETRVFDNQLFYRVKAYTNFFRRNNEFYYYKNHELRPSGRGFYIQEFDFPVSSEGIDEAKIFSIKIQEAIENYLQEMVARIDSDLFDMADDIGQNVIDLLRGEQIIVGGKPLWVNSDENLETEIVHNPLFDVLCERLREEPLNLSDLTKSLNLVPEGCDEQINPNSRYDYRLLERGLLLDRIKSGFNSLHYLVTQIPQEAIVESPTLVRLFDKNLCNDWNRLISTTFSNDEYSQGRRFSYHLAKAEIDAIEGGLGNGIKPKTSKLRSIAIRLFDLKRHFQQDQEMSEKVSNLIERYVEISEGVNLDYE